MEKKNTLGRNTLYNTAGSLFYLGCQWLLTLLVVRLSGYEAAGDFSLAMSNTNVLFTLATFGLQHYVISDRQERCSASVYLTTRLATCGAALLICALVTLVPQRYTPHQQACILLYMLYKSGEALTDMYQAFEYRAERMDCAFVSFALRGVVSVAGFSLLLRLTGNLAAAIAALSFGTLAVVLLYDRSVCHRLTGCALQPNAAQSLRLLRETYPLMGNSFLTAAIVSLPRSSLERVMGSEALGIYASVAAPAVIVQSAALWLYAPAIVSLTDAWNRRDRAAWRRGQLRVWALLGALFALAFPTALFAGAWGLTLLFGPAIAPHAHLLMPVLTGTVLIAVSYFLSSLLTIARRLHDILLANGLAFLLMLALRLPLIRTLGMNGVSLTVLLSMSLNAAWMAAALLLYSRRHFAQEDGHD